MEPDKPDRALSWGWVFALGIYHVALVIVFAYLLYELWPVPWPKDGGPPVVSLFWNSVRLQSTFDGRMILIALIAGGLGAYIHAASSLADYVGNRTFESSWILWYLLRPFIGMALALVLYVVVRAGFVSVSTVGTTPDSVNPYGIAALAALAGIFSKHASDKLDEIFSTILRTAPGAGDDKRKNKLVEAALTIVQLVPSTVKQGTKGVVLTIKGSGFVQGASCNFNGKPRRTEYRTGSELVATLDDADTATAGEHKITVRNPAPHAVESKATAFNVEA